MTTRVATTNIETICVAEPSEMSPGPALRLTSIQILRGLAAVCVVFHHYALLMEESARPSLIVRTGLGSLGAAGVDMFFVISGFIMVHTTMRSSGSQNALHFMVKRSWRVFPLYWFWTTILLLLWLSGLALKSHHYSPSYIASSYVLIPAFNGESWHPLLDQGWTLSFEMLFYLTFACAIVLAPVLAKPIGVLLLLPILNAAGQLLSQDSGLHHLLTDPIIFEFALGVGAALIASRLRSGRNPWTARSPRVLLVVGSSLLLAGATAHPTNWMRPIIWGGPCFLVVLGAALLNRSHFHRALIFLGDASYSIYLAHAFFTLACAVALRRFAFMHAIHPDALIVLGTVVTVPLASASYRWVEQPLMQRVSSLPRATHARV